jgi:hypothetical protein
MVEATLNNATPCFLSIAIIGKLYGIYTSYYLIQYLELSFSSIFISANFLIEAAS